MTVGTIPGAGGTQRLARILGRQKAMDMILTSSTVAGKEPEKLGLFIRSFPLNALLMGALASARKIASRSAPVVRLAKESILTGKSVTSRLAILIIPRTYSDNTVAEETHLDAGLRLERSLYYSSLSLEDRPVGMAAFVEKRQPVFDDR